MANNDVSPPSTIAPPPGSDRKTRGFRVHIEPRTHTVTRTNKKQKITVKQEPIQIKEEPSSSTDLPIKGWTFSFYSSNPTELLLLLESKRSRLGKGKRPSSPSSVTMNILNHSSSPTKKKRRSSATTADSSDLSMAKLDLSSPTYPPAPLLDTRNPVTWNVNDVCSYLNQSGCSFALKTIQEQEIDGAALLLLDDLPKVQDLLEFKLGPAVKFCHVVEQLRTQVIDTFHSSPSLKTSRLSTNHSS